MAIIVERKSYYKIGEISKLLELETHVIRYWESIFSNEIRPETTGTNRKLYTRSDLEMFAVIRYLVRDAQFSMEGARARIAELRQTGELADLKLALIEYEEKQGIGSLAALSQLVSSRKKACKTSALATSTSSVPTAQASSTNCDDISSCSKAASSPQSDLEFSPAQLNAHHFDCYSIRENLTDCQTELQKLQQSFQSHQAVLEHAATETCQSQADFFKLQADLSLLQKALAERDATIQEISQTLECSKKEVDELKATLEHCEAKYAKALNTNSEQAQTLSAINKEFEVTRNDLSGVCDELEITQRLAAQLQRQFNAQTLELTKALETIASKESEVATHIETIASKESEIATHLETIQTRDAELAQALETIDARDTQIAENLETIAGKESEIAQLKAEISRYISELTQTRLTIAERDTQIDNQEKNILLLQRSMETSKIHTQKMHETCTSLKTALSQARAEFNLQTEEKAQLEKAHQALNDQLMDTEAELVQCRHIITLNQAELEQCQTDLDKCQAELLDTHEILSMRETELELSRQEVSDCKELLVLNAAEISAKNAEIQTMTQEIFDFKAQKYPERCTSLQEQLLAMTRHAQTYEQRIDGMEKERRSLRLALLNEIEYLRSA